MVFEPPSWVPKLTSNPPDSIPIAEFLRNEKYGRRPVAKSRNPFTCGLTGRTATVDEFFRRSDSLARALSKRTGWQPNEGTCWDKVVGIFSFNTIDYLQIPYAIHRLSGICSPANAAYSVAELTHQLKTSSVKVLFTCVPLLQTALKAADAANVPRENIFILPMAFGGSSGSGITIDDLVAEGDALPELDALRWNRGQGARQPAFLCYSSGTSGLPKAVMISHRNVISNMMQFTAYEALGREKKGVQTQAVLGLMPMSHIYGLVVVSHSGPYRGDGVIVLPNFEIETYLAAIQRFKIEELIVVPPTIIRMIQSRDLCRKYDLSSVRYVYSGAAPLGEETIQELISLYPAWTIGQAYGMTETSVVVTSQSEHDIMVKASGSLLPGYKAKIIDPEGAEITEHDKPGELLIQSPSVVLGYLNNEKATTETFVHHDDGRWVRTGDEVIMTKAPSGNEQLVVVDRIKELIKGHQVAPAELEAHILAHEAVSDCAVTQVPDRNSGEVPKAYVVKSPAFATRSDEEMSEIVQQHVKDHKSSYKWLRGGVEVLSEIPKSPSGKILRRLLRDREKERRKKTGARL
ncbi:AMP-binding enzyme domain-containing protein [Sarocladium implicatum]|nr:AMP-binding enzyme domain-containing protein [Sarocladium implicatum]